MLGSMWRRSWWLLGLLGCVPVRVAQVTPDSVPAHHGGEFMALAVSALIVLALIPLLSGSQHGGR